MHLSNPHYGEAATVVLWKSNRFSGTEKVGSGLLLCHYSSAAFEPHPSAVLLCHQ